MSVQKKEQKPIYMIAELPMKLFSWISAAVMIFTMIIISVDVFFRYGLNRPIMGVTETCAMLMAWVAYAGMAYGLVTGQHMQLGTVYDKLTMRPGHILRFFVHLLCFLLAVVMTRAGWTQFAASFAIMEKSVASVTVYVWIGKFGVFIGWLLMAFQSLLMVIYCACGIKNPALPVIGHKSDLDEAIKSNHEMT